jgi:hypothetical protein
MANSGIKHHLRLCCGVICDDILKIYDPKKKKKVVFYSGNFRLLMVKFQTRKLHQIFTLIRWNFGCLGSKKNIYFFYFYYSKKTTQNYPGLETRDASRAPFPSAAAAAADSGGGGAATAAAAAVVVAELAGGVVVVWQPYSFCALVPLLLPPPPFWWCFDVSRWPWVAGRVEMCRGEVHSTCI